MGKNFHSFFAASIALQAAAASPAIAAPVFNSPADVRAITAIEDDIATQTSMDALIHYFAPHAVILDFFAPGLYQGKAEIYKSFSTQLAGMKSMTHQMQEINVASDGKFACDALEINFNVTLKNNRVMKLSLRQLDSFQKQGGQWQLVQQHISLPTDPKTGIMVMNGPLPVRGALDWSANPMAGPAISRALANTEIRQWLKANSEVQSPAQLAAFFVPHDALLYNEYLPGELRGRQEISANYAPLMNSIASVTVTMPVVAVNSDGLMGAQIDMQEAKLIMKDGSKHDLLLRQSDCLQLVDGKWYSMLEMVSFALDFKTGKAIIENPAMK